MVNQKLALRLLQQMGYRADLASNGIEAIESVQRQTYDVVLMDVQMPEMDGLEASRQITARWGPPERPRIIAMTANAMQGDRDMCLAAGMDDYLTKPIRVERLVEVLKPGPPRAGTDDEYTRQSIVPPSTRSKDMTGAAIRARAHGHVSSRKRQRCSTTLRDGLEAQDADKFRRAAHSLKSNSNTFGALALGAMARELELAGVAKVAANGAQSLDALDQEYARVAEALSALRHA